jgi:hypothetical protein
MPAQASQDLNAFVTALHDSTFFTKVGRSFALLTPGDWDGLRRWAGSFGYTFTLQDLLTHCTGNPNILGQMSNSPQLSGWKLESLQHAAQA